MRILGLFAVLSVVGAVIGYTTKWVSVQLMFRPARYVGIGPIGWQGVVQRRSPKFAAGVADMLEDIAPVSEVLDRIDPAEFGEVVGESLEPVVAELAPRLLERMSPGAWEAAPEQVRSMATVMLRQDTQDAVIEIAVAAKPMLVQAFDLKPMVVEMLSGDNADTLARLVLTLADRELRTVIRYGAVVGFFVGLVEAGAYLMFTRWWLLPVIGAVDGLVNNWMGIQMIFRPLEPRRYLGVFRYQGLFPSRQEQIARDYGAATAAEVLTPRALVEEIANSPAHDDLARIVHEVLDRRLAERLDLLGPALGVEVTPDMPRRRRRGCAGGARGDGRPGPARAGVLPRTRGLPRAAPRDRADHRDQAGEDVEDRIRVDPPGHLRGGREDPRRRRRRHRRGDRHTAGRAGPRPRPALTPPGAAGEASVGSASWRPPRARACCSSWPGRWPATWPRPCSSSTRSGPSSSTTRPPRSCSGQSFSVTGPVTSGQWGGAMFHPEDLEGNAISLDDLPLGEVIRDRRPAHAAFFITGLDGVRRSIAATSFPLFAQARRARRGGGGLLGGGRVRARIWGCRGSLASPGRRTVRYGGNTSCVEVRVDDDNVLVLDAGSGMRSLGYVLDAEPRRRHPRAADPPPPRPPPGPGLLPARSGATTWSCTSGGRRRPRAAWPTGSPATCRRRCSPSTSPRSPRARSSTTSPTSRGPSAPPPSPAAPVSHQGPTAGFRIEGSGPLAGLHPRPRAGARAPTCAALEPEWISGYALAAGADVLFHDAQYTDAEYRDPRRAGATRASTTPSTSPRRPACGQLVLFHHDPSHTDADLEVLRERGARASGTARDAPVLAADDMMIELAPGQVTFSTADEPERPLLLA